MPLAKVLRRAAGVLAIVVAGVGLSLVPQVAQAAPAGSNTVGVYQELVNSHTNKVRRRGEQVVLHVGDLALQQGCTPDSTDANWLISVDGGFVKLVQLSSGMCLDLNRGSTSNGARIQLCECDTSGNAQDWYFT